MQTPLSAADLRKWAQQCDDDARNPRISGDERDQLMAMKSTLLALVDDVDWIETRRGRAGVPEGIRNVSFHL